MLERIQIQNSAKTQIGILLNELKEAKGKDREEKLKTLMGISLLLLREKEMLEADLRRQKRLKLLRIGIGLLIGLMISILFMNEASFYFLKGLEL